MCIKKRRVKITTESIISEFVKIHGDKYDYSLVDYKTMHIKINIICKQHGIFNVGPKEHLYRGHGCSKCAFIEQSNIQKDSTENFIIKAKKLHNNRYDYTKVNYGKNAHEKIIITCRQHGDFKISPNSHLSKKNGCPICSKIKSKRKLKTCSLSDKENWIKRCNNRKATLYILYCYNDFESFIKIGITSYSVNFRYRSRFPYKYKILKQIESDNLELIWDLENKILKDSIQFRYKPKLYFPGITECRTIKFNYETIKN